MKPRPPQPAPRTQALRELEAWIDPSAGRTGAALASMVGVSAAAVSQWRARKSRPEHDVRTRIRIAIGIAEEGWETEKEKTARIEKERRASDPLPEPKRVAV